MKKDLISIIIPCFNVERYLPIFFKCILNQTYKNNEIIFIDDGSTDRTLTLLNEFAKANKNINTTIIHQFNAGVSAARNTGIAQAKGEFIFMPDPDDAFNFRILEILFKAIKENNADVAMCKCKKISDKSTCIYNTKNKKIKSTVFNGYDSVMSHHLGMVVQATWNKLFRHDIVRKIKNYPSVFKVSSFRGEDSLFCSNYLVFCKKSVLINKKLYYYRQHRSSITHTEFTKEYLTIFDSQKFLLSLDKELYVNTQKYIRASLCIDSIDCIHRIYKSKKIDNRNIARFVYDIYKKNYKYVIKCKYYPNCYRFGIAFTPLFMYLMIKKYLD